MDASLNKYIWKHSRPQQIILVLMTMASFPDPISDAGNSPNGSSMTL